MCLCAAIEVCGCQMCYSWVYWGFDMSEHLVAHFNTKILPELNERMHDKLIHRMQVADAEKIVAGGHRAVFAYQSLCHFGWHLALQLLIEMQRPSGLPAQLRQLSDAHGVGHYNPYVDVRVR